MKSLGNRFIETRTGPPIQIADPSAASDLLDLATQCAAEGRRLLFFCGCRLLRIDGKTACHRDTVAGLVPAAAKRAGSPVSVVEWPGGEPEDRDLDVTRSTWEALGQESVTLALASDAEVRRLRCLPWASVVTVRSGVRAMRVLSGPASYSRGQWLLPAYERFAGTGVAPSAIKRRAAALRETWGLKARSTG